MQTELHRFPEPPDLTPSNPVVRAAELQVWNDADEAVQAARTYLETVNSTAAKIFETARADGKAKGHQEGATRIADLLARTEAAAAKRLDDIEQALPDIVMECVERIIGRVDPSDALIRIITCALKERVDVPSVILTVSSRLDEKAIEAVNGLIEATARPAVTLRTDSHLEPKQAVLATPAGSIDLSVKAQIAVLRKALSSRRDERTP